MSNIFNFIQLKKRKREQKSDKVYEFFARSKSSVRKRAYEDALRMVQKDQVATLKKAELRK